MGKGNAPAGINGKMRNDANPGTGPAGPPPPLSLGKDRGIVAPSRSGANNPVRTKRAQTRDQSYPGKRASELLIQKGDPQRHVRRANPNQAQLQQRQANQIKGEEARLQELLQQNEKDINEQKLKQSGVEGAPQEFDPSAERQGSKNPYHKLGTRTNPFKGGRMPRPKPGTGVVGPEIGENQVRRSKPLKSQRGGNKGGKGGRNPSRGPIAENVRTMQ